VDLSLNLLASSAVGILNTSGVTIDFSPQREPPVIDVNTNWAVPANASNASYVLPFEVWDDTSPASEPLGVGASVSSPGPALHLTLGTSPGADEFWSLVASNYIATNAVLITLTATNDVGLFTYATVTLYPVLWLDMVGPVTNARCTLRLSVFPGNSYAIQVSTNPFNTWSNLALVVPTNSPIFFIDTNAAPGSRYYRLRGL
jgi:hypothetical protein